MKLFFKSIIVGVAAWIVFRIVFYVGNGNSVSDSAKTAIGAPIRVTGALIGLATNPQAAAAAGKTLKNEFSGATLSYKDLSPRWAKSIADVYSLLNVNATSTSQNDSSVNAPSPKPIFDVSTPSYPA